VRVTVRQLVGSVRATLLLVGALLIAILALPQAHASASTTLYDWYFTKNASDQTSSVLGLYQNTVGGPTIATFRAGSGITGHENECESNYGWIPSGWGNITGYNHNYPGTTVTGPVLILANRPCYNGTVRTELFVHSSYPWLTSHYQSNGCVKVSNTGGPAGATGQIASVISLHITYSYPLQFGA
jgi:hypothetical protein